MVSAQSHGPSPVAGNQPDHEDCTDGLAGPDWEALAARPLKAMPTVDPMGASFLRAGRARGLLCAPGQGAGPTDPLGAAGEPGPRVCCGLGALPWATQVGLPAQRGQCLRVLAQFPIYPHGCDQDPGLSLCFN